MIGPLLSTEAWSDARPAFDAVLFDLDGTLVDSRSGIEASCMAAMAEVAPGADLPALGDMLGKPLGGLMDALGAALSAERIVALRAAFARHYDVNGWRASEPYPDVVETLQAVIEAGARCFVVTNKRSVPTHAILRAFGLAPHLSGVVTPDSTAPPFTDKSAMALACCRQFGIDGAAAIVVGDSVEDRQAATACGAQFAAAAYGYGDVVNGDRSNGIVARPIFVVLKSIGDLKALFTPRGAAGRSA